MRTNTMTKLSLALISLTLACSGGSDAAGTPTQPPAQVGVVQGTVRDDAAAAVSGAGLTLTATGQTALSGTSGSDGSFSFTQVPVGAWTLTVTPPAGYGAVAQSSAAVTVTAGQTASVSLAVKKDAGTPQSGNVNVSVADFSFTPSSLTITSGSTVTWKNDGNVTHTATADGAEFDSGNLASGASFSHTFSTKGTFTYHCAIHASMTGTITVQ